MTVRWSRFVQLLALGVVVAAACTSPGATPSATIPPSSPSDVAPASATPTPSEPAAREFVVAVIGDWGAGTPMQADVMQQMCAERERSGFEIVVTVGDNFYENGFASSRNYEVPARCLYSHPDHQWRAVWGNHDVRQGEDTREVLGADRWWYRWSIGDAEFFMLDSNQANDEVQRDWLDEKLAASTASMKVAVFHHPPFTAGDDHLPDERVLANWVPLFERHDVTLVLSGHSHLYEHHRARGIDYVVTGGGGAWPDGCARNPSSLRICTPKHHFLVLTIRDDGIVVRAVGRYGAKIDRFVATP